MRRKNKTEETDTTVDEYLRHIKKNVLSKRSV